MRRIVRRTVRLTGFFVLPYKDRTGRGHWLVQRLSAVALLPLYAWMLIVGLPEASTAQYAELLAWMQNPVNAVLLYFTIVLSLHHMVLGLRAIVEDYIATPSLNAIALFCLHWGSFFFMLVVLAAVFRILWQS